VVVYTDRGIQNVIQKAGKRDKSNDCIILQRLCAVVYLCAEQFANNELQLL
jgi:hypothetical protein